MTPLNIILNLNSAQALGKLNEFIGAASSKLAGFAAALLSIHEVFKIEEMIESFSLLGEKLDETASRAAGLAYAANLSNVSIEGLQRGMKALSEEMVKNGEADRSVIDKMLDVSDMFSKTEGAARRAQLAVQYFGKAGLDMIPVLNQGSEALRELIAKGEDLYGLDGKATKQAKEFNDAMVELKATAAGLGITIVKELGDSLVFVIKLLAGALEVTKSLVSAWADLWKALGVASTGQGFKLPEAPGGAEQKKKDLHDETFLTKDLYEAKKKLLEIDIIQYKQTEQLAKADYKLDPEKQQQVINRSIENQIKALKKLRDLDSEYNGSGGMSNDDLKLNQAKTTAQIHQLEPQIEPSGWDQINKQVDTYFQNIGTLSEQTGKIITSTFTTAFDSIGSQITKVIMGTQTLRQAFANIGTTILNEVISSLIKMAAQYVVTHVIIRGVEAVTHALSEGHKAAATASTLTQEAAKAPILATNAATSSVGSYGASAIVGAALAIAAIGAIIAFSASAREYGGPVSAGNAYVVGERRPELFIPSVSGYIMPSVPSAQASGQNGGSTVNEIHMHQWDDEQSYNRHLQDNPQATHILLNKLRKEGHRI